MMMTSTTTMTTMTITTTRRLTIAITIKPMMVTAMVSTPIANIMTAVIKLKLAAGGDVDAGGSAVLTTAERGETT
jgi:hypothetical protein